MVVKDNKQLLSIIDELIEFADTLKYFYDSSIIDYINYYLDNIKKFILSNIDIFIFKYDGSIDWLDYHIHIYDLWDFIIYLKSIKDLFSINHHITNTLYTIDSIDSLIKYIEKNLI